MADHPIIVEVESDRDPETRYVVTLWPSGAVRCTCPSGQYRPGLLCKHARRVLEHQKRETSDGE